MIRGREREEGEEPTGKREREKSSHHIYLAADFYTHRLFSHRPKLARSLAYDSRGRSLSRRKDEASARDRRLSLVSNTTSGRGSDGGRVAGREEGRRRYSGSLSLSTLLRRERKYVKSERRRVCHATIYRGRGSRSFSLPLFIRRFLMRFDARFLLCRSASSSLPSRADIYIRYSFHWFRVARAPVLFRERGHETVAENKETIFSFFRPDRGDDGNVICRQSRTGNVNLKLFPPSRGPKLKKIQLNLKKGGTSELRSIRPS